MLLFCFGGGSTSVPRPKATEQPAVEITWRFQKLCPRQDLPRFAKIRQELSKNLPIFAKTVAPTGVSGVEENLVISANNL